MEFKFSGKIMFKYIDEWEHLILITEDGLNVNLIYRFHELKLSFPNKSIGISYHISNELISEEKAIESHLKKVLGCVDAGIGFEEGEVYSEMSCDPDYYWSTLTIGGHDLKNELRNYSGKYLMLNVKIFE